MSGCYPTASEPGHNGKNGDVGGHSGVINDSSGNGDVDVAMVVVKARVMCPGLGHGQ